MKEAYPWPEGPYRPALSGFDRVPTYEVGTSTSFCIPHAQYIPWDQEGGRAQSLMMCLAPQMARAILEDDSEKISELKGRLQNILDKRDYSLVETETELQVQLDGEVVASAEFEAGADTKAWRQQIVDFAGEYALSEITSIEGKSCDLYSFLQVKHGPIVTD